MRQLVARSRPLVIPREARIGKHGFTWLHAAAALGHADRAHFLCNAGAPLEAIDLKRLRASPGGHAADTLAGTTPLFRAVIGSRWRYTNALCCAAAAALLERGADVNSTSHRLGWTPLNHLCAEPPGGLVAGDDLPTMRLLVTSGADVTVVDPASKGTLLHAIAGRRALLPAHVKGYESHAHIVRFLLDCGCDIDRYDKAHRTALTRAMLSNPDTSKTAFHALLEAGADANTILYGDQSALHYASEHCDAAVVSALIRYGAVVNALEVNGYPALIFVATCRNHDRGLKNAEVLLAQGAEVNAGLIGGRGCTALRQAHEVGNYPLVDLLCLHGAINIE